MASCSGFLDHVPDERTEITNETNVQNLLISAYPDVNPSWVNELQTDNLIDNQAPHMPSNPNDKQKLSHYNYGHYYDSHNYLFRFEVPQNMQYSEYDSPGMLWNGYYSSISSVNFMLDGIRQMSGTDTEKYSQDTRRSYAEALLLRAYDHFQLVNIFSKAYRDAELSKEDVGIPYVTETENVVIKPYDRGNVADVYAKIGADLEEALKFVTSLNFVNAPKYHFNMNAAHAFASRYYLATRQYEKVIEHADQVLTTDTAQMRKLLMNYGGFGECSTTEDFGNVWQDPAMGNNLMLICTSSLLQRMAWGARYSCAGEAAREALMVHNSDLWSGYICPAQAIVGGMIFGSSSGDYGFFHCKTVEQFQYSDKIAGIGYPHIIYRAFTGNELLLERAEAEIMLHRYADAERDLLMYWNSGLDSFSKDDYKAYVTAGYTKYITRDNIITPAGQRKKAYYSDSSKPNCFDSWDFTQTMSPEFVVPADAVPYMNCLNDFRRFENVFEGLRSFDIKRWGLPLKHISGVNSEELVSEPLSDLRAIEAPTEALSAGIATSRPTTTRSACSARLNINSLRDKTTTEDK